MPLRRRGPLTAMALAVIAACSSTENSNVTPPPPPPPPGPPAVVRVDVTPATPGVWRNDTLRLSATVRLTGGGVAVNPQLTWSSSDPTVASVSTSGLVTGVIAGAAEIRATSSGVTGAAQLTVREDVNPPSAVIETPTLAEGYVTLLDTVSVSGSAYDDHGLREVRYRVGTGPVTKATGISSWQIGPLSLSPGDNLVEITAVDSAFNLGTAQIRLVRNSAANFLGPPQLTPLALTVNVATTVTVRVSLGPSPQLDPASVTLVKVDSASGAAQGNVVTLVDNGNLASGDEIAGDGVFSGKPSLTANTTGSLFYRVRARALGGSVDEWSPLARLTAHFPLTANDRQAQQATLDTVTSELERALGKTHDVQKALDSGAVWLRSRPRYTEVVRDGLWLIYRNPSGVTGGIVVTETDASGNEISRGGPVGAVTSGRAVEAVEAVEDTVRRARSSGALPVALMTRGSLQAGSGGSGASLKGPDDLILSRKVLIYAPFETAFGIGAEGAAVAAMFTNATNIQYEVTYLKDRNASVLELEDLPKYGFVLFATHGSGGSWILTGELVIPGSTAWANELQANQVGEFRKMTVNHTLWIFPIKLDVYGVSQLFIYNLQGQLPNSVIFNNSCESLQRSFLATAFIQKGAKAYLGYTESVSSIWAGLKAKEFALPLAAEKKTGEAFIPFQDDPLGVFGLFTTARYAMVGSRDVHFTSSLQNGDFEYGDLTAWKTTGDGRSITALGGQRPIDGQFMAIVSTGLGLTTSAGTIEQSFRVPDNAVALDLFYNFLSEEFMEYVGSQFQDVFEVAIREGSNRTVVYRRTIDQIAAEFSLTKVSPGIVFDQGDVYMTGWKPVVIDLSPWRTKTVVLEISTGDVGDSAYDTAVLVDGIKLR